MEEPPTDDETLDVSAFVASALETDPLVGRIPVTDGGRFLGGARVIRKLGQGGIGIVYLAHHVALDVPVAVKVLGRERDRDAGERFVREARVAARIDHPN